eukprot:CAMPEP_0170124588 /NCGR_PEP_ID=MMETSP0020_2-20130122/18358_1 /TAXON_ID=98059 /ORGANISM="Dinobryon sp., Strain UTEXLB2267" /LENGTH=195 /DNA_ID=CAMNT_0010356733 /DNA_START=132 /DNA_END=719 /DNA_ORIENTATION=-
MVEEKLPAVERSLLGLDELAVEKRPVEGGNGARHLIAMAGHDLELHVALLVEEAKADEHHEDQGDEAQTGEDQEAAGRVRGLVGDEESNELCGGELEGGSQLHSSGLRDTMFTSLWAGVVQSGMARACGQQGREVRHCALTGVGVLLAIEHFAGGDVLHSWTRNVEEAFAISGTSHRVSDSKGTGGIDSISTILK